MAIVPGVLLFFYFFFPLEDVQASYCSLFLRIYLHYILLMYILGMHFRL